MGQSVKTGDALVEIEEAGGFRTTIVSPIAGTVSLGSAQGSGEKIRLQCLLSERLLEQTVLCQQLLLPSGLCV